MKEIEKGSPLKSAFDRISKAIKVQEEVIKVLEELCKKKTALDGPQKEQGLYHLNKACSILNEELKPQKKSNTKT